MIALGPNEVFSAWLLLHLVLFVMPLVSAFLIYRRGRLHLWHFAVGVVLVALLLVPGVPCRGLFSRPETWPFVMSMFMRSWVTSLLALVVGCGLGALVLRSGRMVQSS